MFNKWRFCSFRWMSNKWQFCSDEFPTSDVSIFYFLRNDCVQMGRGQNGGTSGKQSPPHPEGSVSQDGMVGKAQKCKIDS